MISDKEAIERVVEILLFLVLASFLLTSLLDYFSNYNVNTSGTFLSRLLDYFLYHFLPVWKIIALIISGLAVAGIIHNLWKLRAINIAENLFFNSGIIAGKIDNERLVEEPKNERWEQILKYLNSDNSSDWRQSILEADIMLEELLRDLGYPGDSMGEMLKAVEKEDFLSLEEAWEAHKIRNTIAHSGGEFQLNQRETRRVIGLYEKVFREFDIV